MFFQWKIENKNSRETYPNGTNKLYIYNPLLGFPGKHSSHNHTVAMEKL